MKNLKVIFVFLCLISLFSCRNSRIVYEDIKTLPYNWTKNDDLVFDFVAEDTINLYDFSIFLKHNTFYQWQNLFLFLDTKYPDGTVSRDTLECILAEASGRWLGKSSSKKKEITYLLKKVRFPQQGEYQFIIEQGMREENLRNIENIGIIIMNNK
jgi:gliding motility-associated lipoprotein GldH